MTKTILLTGANRGIGLELTRQYAEADWRVYACCRAPETATDLNAIAAGSGGRVSVHPLDVTNAAQVGAVAQVLGDAPLDILFNNAGIYGQFDAAFGNTDESKWLDAFRVNTIAPMKLIEALVDNVAASDRKIVAAMSSKMASMADNHSGGSYVYRSSKAALNAAMTSVAVDLRPRGVGVAILHPGWVRTDMGGPNGEIDVVQSARGLRNILDAFTLDQSGTFFDIDASTIPW